MERWMVRFFIKHFPLRNALYVYISSNILLRMSYEILCILVYVIGNHHWDKCRNHGGGIWELWKKLWGRKSFARHTKFLGSIFWQSSNNSFRHISTATSFTSDICRYISKRIKRNNLSKKYKNTKRSWKLTSLLPIGSLEYDEKKHSRANYQRAFGWDPPRPIEEEEYNIVGTVSAPESTFYNDYEK